MYSSSLPSSCLCLGREEWRTCAVVLGVCFMVGFENEGFEGCSKLGGVFSLRKLTPQGPDSKKYRSSQKTRSREAFACRGQVQ